MGTREYKTLALKLIKVIKFLVKLIIFLFGCTIVIQVLILIGGGILFLASTYGNRDKDDFIDLSARPKVELQIPDSLLIGILKSPVKKENDYGITCDGIYEIDFSDLSKVNLFYTNKEYAGYGNPFLKNGQLYCSAIKSSTLEMEDKISVILKVENGEAVEVMRTHRDIADFHLIDDHAIIYSYRYYSGSAYDKEYNIEIYDRNTGETNKIFNYHINTPRPEFLVTTNPVTLIVEGESERIDYIDEAGKPKSILKSPIIQVNEAGESKVLIEDGRFPSWYEEGKSILYQKVDGSVLVYDIEDHVSAYLGKVDVPWDSRAMISPDKKFLAINEPYHVRASEAYYSLIKVVTVDGNAEMNAPLLRHIGAGQVFWLKK